MADEELCFVIVKAANCGMCVNRLEPLMPHFYKRFKDEKIEIIEYKIDAMRVNKDRNGNSVYPESLGLIWWYPFMFFTTKRIFEEIKSGKDRRDSISIVNGYFSNEGYVLEEKSPINPFDPNILIQWGRTDVKKDRSDVKKETPRILEAPKEVVISIDSNPFLPSSEKKKNILELNYCGIKIVPKKGRS